MNPVKHINGALTAAGDEDRPVWLRLFLSLISYGYGAVVKFRYALYQKKIPRTQQLPCMVISVGNITAGGTGKTPMTIHLAKMIERLGCHVAVISRGYKGRAERTGGVVCDGRSILMAPDMAGDEPFMIAKALKTIPVVVGQNRFKAGMQAIKEFKVDVVLLDDGFQHLRLDRDLNLVLLDYKDPFGNGHLLPRGSLREPVGSLFRGDAFVLTRYDSFKDTAINRSNRLPPGKPVFISSHRPFVSYIFKGGDIGVESDFPELSVSNSGFLKGHPAVCFSGIARNDDFLHTVNNIGCKVIRFFSFPDHHRYSDRDINEIIDAAKQTKSKFILTTEKDFVRIQQKIVWPCDFVVIDVKIFFEPDEKPFNRFIKSRIEEFKKRPMV